MRFGGGLPSPKGSSATAVFEKSHALMNPVTASRSDWILSPCIEPLTSSVNASLLVRVNASLALAAGERKRACNPGRLTVCLRVKPELADGLIAVGLFLSSIEFVLSDELFVLQNVALSAGRTIKPSDQLRLVDFGWLLALSSVGSTYTSMRCVVPS